MKWLVNKRPCQKRPSLAEPQLRVIQENHVAHHGFAPNVLSSVMKLLHFNAEQSERFEYGCDNDCRGDGDGHGNAASDRLAVLSKSLSRRSSQPISGCSDWDSRAAAEVNEGRIGVKTSAVQEESFHSAFKDKAELICRAITDIPDKIKASECWRSVLASTPWDPECVRMKLCSTVGFFTPHSVLRGKPQRGTQLEIIHELKHNWCPPILSNLLLWWSDGCRWVTLGLSSLNTGGRPVNLNEGGTGGHSW
ncbi:hypothetical protein Baya_9302 [Bagarius yarrelli]|uniref:Uncharacterized protein n=1 Tax=Bagarius yarrelli TaxID=175774 RepID=A0A556U786_BAGYA|nr:hypothetical protein Baya_9302 [Bagarius yarrelli]